MITTLPYLTSAEHHIIHSINSTVLSIFCNYFALFCQHSLGTDSLTVPDFRIKGNAKTKYTI